MRASSKRPRVDSSSSGAPPPSSIGDPIADAYVDPTDATAPPPTTLDDSDKLSKGNHSSSKGGGGGDRLRHAKSALKDRSSLSMSTKS